MIRYRDARPADLGPLPEPDGDLTAGRWTLSLDDGELSLVDYDPRTWPAESLDRNTRGEERGMRDRFPRLFRLDPEE